MAVGSGIEPRGKHPDVPMVSIFFVKKCSLLLCCLGHGFLVSWILSWAIFWPQLGPKSLPTWGPRATLGTTFCLYLQTSIFDTPPMKILLFSGSRGCLGEPTSLENRSLTTRCVQSAFQNIFLPTGTQHKPNLGPKLAPSWTQDGPKMAHVDPKMA